MALGRLASVDQGGSQVGLAAVAGGSVVGQAMPGLPLLTSLRGKRLVMPMQERQPQAALLRGCMQTGDKRLCGLWVSGSTCLFNEFSRVTEAVRPEPN